MWKCYVYVIAIWPLIAGEESNILYTDGWVPVSSDVVYDQIKRGHAQIPDVIATHNIQVLNTDINVSIPEQQFVNEEAIADKTDESFNTKFRCSNRDTDCDNETPNKYPIAHPMYDFLPNVFYIPIKNKSISTTARRSKKMGKFNFKTYVQNLLLDENKAFSKNTYEVTEDFESESTYKEESAAKDIGYKYEPPNKQNKTTGLFEILSKYKIHKDDELPNYTLSRRQKAQISKPNVPLKPFQITNQHNNLNHLPVDPLLAVFLSNYGYYLQGMYGIRNRYNNLYGYLASNNIHNNRPFGVYKVFSDTDSSH